MNRSTSWKFQNPVHIHFGNETLKKLPELWKYHRVLLVATPGTTRRGLTARISEMLDGSVVHVLDNVSANPDFSQIEMHLDLLRDTQFDCIIGVGGGSAIDTAKVLSVSLVRSPTLSSLEELMVSGSKAFPASSLPLLAIPTSAGSGSEVTPFATIWDFKKQKKNSVCSPLLFPHTAIIDPSLTLTVDEKTTLATGLDALSQGFESVWNQNANAISLQFAFESVRLTLQTLELLKRNPSCLQLRTQMSTASLMAGLAISSTKTALAHSISYPLTLKLGLIHGFASSFTLPALLEFNSQSYSVPILRLAEYLELGSVDNLVTKLVELLESLEISKWLHGNVRCLDDLLVLVPEMITPDRAGNNVRFASADDIVTILRRTNEFFPL